MYKSAKHIFALLFLLSVGYTSFGQLRPVYRRPPNLQERVIRQNQAARIEAVKERYINRRLNLTAGESERFWPIYRQYQEKIVAIRKKKRLNNSSAQPDGTEQIQNELNYEADLVNVRKQYTNEFLKFLPSEKVSELFKAEREFQDELIKQLHERNQAVNTTPAN
jgi:hypothetical protein